MSNKVKFFKNSNRSAQDKFEPYVPQYQILGVEPEEYKSPILPEGTLVAKSNVGNPRTKSSNNSIPTVGNMDRTWSSLDGDVSENLDNLTMSHEMVDNNDYVSDPSLEESDEVSEESSDTFVDSSKEDASNIPLNVLKELEDSTYLLVVNGAFFSSGAMPEIEDQVKSLVFGEHPMCQGIPISLENIMVLKKVAIKVGIFLE